ncbi:MAG: hypothetical protein ACLT1A_12130 [Dysosmobacter sp.]
MLELTTHGFRIFALCYLFCGLNIYASAFFTALCNALSALIAFTRTLLRGWTGAGDAGVLRRGWRLVVRGGGGTAGGVVLSVVLLVACGGVAALTKRGLSPWGRRPAQVAVLAYIMDCPARAA